MWLQLGTLLPSHITFKPCVIEFFDNILFIPFVVVVVVLHWSSGFQASHFSITGYLIIVGDDF